MSEVAQRVYLECPNDLTSNGCNGDTAFLDNAMGSFLDAYEDVMRWGTPRASEQAKVLLSKLPQARPRCSTRRFKTTHGAPLPGGSTFVEVSFPPAAPWELPDAGEPQSLTPSFKVYDVVCPGGPQYGSPTTVYLTQESVTVQQARPMPESHVVRFTWKKPPDVGAFESAYGNFRAVMRCEVAVEPPSSC